jgi:lactosylceramide 4-alpha-galactosyltransferase
MTKHLHALLSYPNVNILMLKFHEFAFDTPVEEFIIGGQLYNSSYPVEHTSDIFRLLLLWKYGGTYLDSDMIVRRQIDNLGANFACVDGEENIVANAFLNFDLDDGNRLVEIFMHDQMENFMPNEWGHNGPQMLTRVLTKMCQTNSTEEMLSMKNCDGFHVVPRKFAFPIMANHYEKIFNETFTKMLLQKISSNSITVHMWNKLTKNFKTRASDRNLYNILASRHCPKVFVTIDEEF